MTPRLTLRDKHLLRYPPTKRTWVCCKQRTAHFPDGETKKFACAAVNSARLTSCWLCGHVKPKKPQLLWPLYVAACTKAGIAPGTRWPIAAKTPSAPKRPTRRKGVR